MLDSVEGIVERDTDGYVSQGPETVDESHHSILADELFNHDDEDNAPRNDTLPLRHVQ